MTEKRFRALVVELLQPIGAFPVECLVHDGVPDVCCVAGWLELKVAERPNRATTRVDFQMRPAQRLWLKRWRLHGGRAWTLSLLEQTWFLHEGHWAAECLDHVPEDMLRVHAMAVWEGRPTQNELIESLTLALPRIN